jgi:hypothetical protein
MFHGVSEKTSIFVLYGITYNECRFPDYKLIVIILKQNTLNLALTEFIIISPSRCFFVSAVLLIGKYQPIQKADLSLNLIIDHTMKRFVGLET